MRKFVVAVVLASFLLTTLAIPVLADDGNANADVTCSDIDVDGTPIVGYTVTVSGNVTITAEASVDPSFLCAGFTVANSEGFFNIADPDGASVANGSNPLGDMDFGFMTPTSSDASQTGLQVYAWTTDVLLNQTGTWTASHGGEAFAAWLELLFGFIPINGGFDLDDCQVDLEINAIPLLRLQQSFFVIADGRHQEFPYWEGMIVDGAAISWGDGYFLQIPAKDYLDRR